jgi:hypothetical protein
MNRYGFPRPIDKRTFECDTNSPSQPVLPGWCPRDHATQDQTPPTSGYTCISGRTLTMANWRGWLKDGHCQSVDHGGIRLNEPIRSRLGASIVKWGGAGVSDLFIENDRMTSCMCLRYPRVPDPMITKVNAQQAYIGGRPRTLDRRNRMGLFPKSLGQCRTSRHSGQFHSVSLIHCNSREWRALWIGAACRGWCRTSPARPTTTHTSTAYRPTTIHTRWEG